MSMVSPNTFPQMLRRLTRPRYQLHLLLVPLPVLRISRCGMTIRLKSVISTIDIIADTGNRHGKRMRTG